VHLKKENYFVPNYHQIVWKSINNAKFCSSTLGVKDVQNIFSWY